MGWHVDLGVGDAVNSCESFRDGVQTTGAGHLDIELVVVRHWGEVEKKDEYFSLVGALQVDISGSEWDPNSDSKRKRKMQANNRRKKPTPEKSPVKTIASPNVKYEVDFFSPAFTLAFVLASYKSMFHTGM